MAFNMLRRKSGFRIRYSSTDFNASISEVIKDIRDLCNAEHCCILRTYCFYSDTVLYVAVVLVRLYPVGDGLFDAYYLK